MELEKNRINFAKLQIFRYVEQLFTVVSDLQNPDIEELMNMEGHRLSKEDLVVVLNELFETHMLVAKTEKRGLFTPSLTEIELALGEEKDLNHFSENTFYGLTTGANDLYSRLKVLYELQN